MTIAPLRMETVRVRELPAYAAQAAARADPGLLAISPERALSQSRNPAASGDEMGLIAAYQGERCVGYMGLLPATLWDGEATRRVFWMSTWLIAPSLRGTGAGYQILSAALELGYDLFGTMFTSSAGRVLRAAGFHSFGPLEYLELNFRRAAPWAEATRALRRVFRKQAAGWGERAARIDSWAALPGKAVAHRLLRRRWHHLPPGTAVERTDPSAAAGAQPVRASAHGPPHFLRGAEDVRWMLRYPWIRTDSSTAGAAPYHFSHLRRSFEYIPLRWRTDAQGKEASMVLSIGDTGGSTVVKVLDQVLSTEEANRIALSLALRHAWRHRADSLVLPASFAPLVAGDPVLRRLAVSRERWYLFRPADPGDPLAQSLDRFHLTYVDGDVAFT